VQRGRHRALAVQRGTSLRYKGARPCAATTEPTRSWTGRRSSSRTGWCGTRPSRRTVSVQRHQFGILA